MKKQHLLWASCLVLTLASCGKSKEQEVPTPPTPTFSGKIIAEFVTNPALRVDVKTWDINDSIGIYLYNANKRTPTLDNSLYVTKYGNGRFLPAEESRSLSNPLHGQCFAYYPYQKQVQDHTLMLDVNNQTNADRLDLYVTDFYRSVSLTDDTLSLQFKPVLSKIVVNLQAFPSTNDLKIFIEGTKTKGSYQLPYGQINLDGASETTVQVPVKASYPGAEAILIPQKLNTPLRLKVVYHGVEKNIATDISQLAAGHQYELNLSYNAKEGSQWEISAEASIYRKWTETPAISQAMLNNPDMKYINHDYTKDKSVRNYSLLYSTKDKFAYWVAYPLCPYYRGSSGRSEAWDYDPSIVHQWQADYSRGIGGGYDRGHQIPSADRTRDTEMNRATYYFSNMTPQIGKLFNQGIWAKLEEKVRVWMGKTDTIFVVTGALPVTDEDQTRKTYLVKGETVTVPKAYFKALARRVGSRYQTIAFYLPHQEIQDENSYMKYAISVAELEKKTHFTFFPKLDPDSKATFNVTEWNN